MLSCSKVTLLIEKAHTRPLSFAERIKLKMHLAMCDKCTEYRKQSLFIETSLRSHKKTTVNPSNLSLSDNFKTLIQNKIDSGLKKD